MPLWFQLVGNNKLKMKIFFSKEAFPHFILRKKTNFKLDF